MSRDRYGKHQKVAEELEADLDAWAATLQEPGIPHQPINEQEVGWYARHFGHPE